MISALPITILGVSFFWASAINTHLQVGFLLFLNGIQQAGAQYSVSCSAPGLTAERGWHSSLVCGADMGSSGTAGADICTTGWGCDLSASQRGSSASSSAGRPCSFQVFLSHLPSLQILLSSPSPFFYFHCEQIFLPHITSIATQEFHCL